MTMEKRIVFLVLLSMSINVMAQVSGYPTIFSEYQEQVRKAHPDAQADSVLTTNIWKTYYHTTGGNYAFAKYLGTLSDSIVAGKEYMKVVVENTDTLLYRQEGDKVYMYRDGQEFLILDYGLKEGDIFEDAWGGGEIPCDQMLYLRRGQELLWLLAKMPGHLHRSVTEVPTPAVAGGQFT